MPKILVVDSEKVVFDCGLEQSMLDAARVKGIFIPYACKGGGCGLCKIKIEKGNYKRGASSKAVLPDIERENGFSLACKTYPLSNMEILVKLK